MAERGYKRMKNGKGKVINKEYMIGKE